jgi:hypothetical protein
MSARWPVRPVQGRTRNSDVGESAFVGFYDGAGVVGDQPAHYGIGVLGVAQVPGAVELVQAGGNQAGGVADVVQPRGGCEQIGVRAPSLTGWLFGSVEQFVEVLDAEYGAVRPGGYERFKDLPEGSEAFGVAEDDLSSFGQVLVEEIQDFGFA